MPRKTKPKPKPRQTREEKLQKHLKAIIEIAKQNQIQVLTVDNIQIEFSENANKNKAGF
jgi:hypothetical protein